MFSRTQIGRSTPILRGLSKTEYNDYQILVPTNPYQWNHLLTRIIPHLLDPRSVQWITEQDRSKTSLVFNSGTFLDPHAFGLPNEPSPFQRSLHLILTRFKWKTFLIFMDDIIILSKDTEEHIHPVDQILSTLGDAGVTLNLKTCSFFIDSVEYLGHTIIPTQLDIDQAHTKCLKDVKHRTNRSSWGLFLGLCNVYRLFIPYFTGIVHLLNKLPRKPAPENFELCEEQLKYFSTFIEKICSPPVLAL